MREMKELEDDFETKLQNKKKEKHFAEKPSYERLESVQTNEIDEDFIDKMFRIGKKLRERGREKRKEEDLSFSPESPAIALTKVKIPRDEQVFKEKISQLKPLYGICLKIKSGKRLESEKEKKLEELENERMRVLNKARSADSQEEKENYYSKKEEIDQKIEDLK